jgi:serine protease Do
MITKNNFKITLGLVALLLAILACGPKPTVEVVNTETPVEAEATPAVEKPVDTGNLTREQKSQLAHATVRIWGVKNQNGNSTPIYHGSGTILTPDGLILTNCHVADPLAMGMSPDIAPDALLIDMIATEDKPPVSTYIAKVVTEDPTLDLATIQIVSNLDGSKVNLSSLNLPTVPVGDSDQVKFGDPLFIFGYPGIGGDTITYVTGDVAGFDSEQPIGDRAWIKTEATIAGGNSGGLAVNSMAEIIGVPSQVGTGSATKTTDCRRIQDTNGDGVIDDKDSCIPTGGFINGIRPINWAKPLIDAAQSGRAYTSPYKGPDLQAGPDVNPSGSVGEFKLLGWADDIDSNSCPVNVIDKYPSGPKRVTAVFSFSGMTSGEAMEWHWYLDGKDVGSNSNAWDLASKGNCYALYLQNGSDPLPDGAYAVAVFAGPNKEKIAQAQTSVGGSQVDPKTGGGVVLSGQVTDANTGRGIAGIFVAVLQPGIDPDTWVNSPQDSEVFSFIQTDQNGDYLLPTPLERGQKYGMVVGNNKLGYPSSTGYLTVKQNSPDALNLPIKISK